MAGMLASVALVFVMKKTPSAANYTKMSRGLTGLLSSLLISGWVLGATGLSDFSKTYSMSSTVVAGIIFFSIFNLGVLIFESLLVSKAKKMPVLKAHASDVVLDEMPDNASEKGMSKSSSMASVDSQASIHSDDTWTNPNKQKSHMTSRILGYETDQSELIKTKAGFVKLEDE